MPPKKTIKKAKSVKESTYSYILMINFKCDCGMDSAKFMGNYDTKAEAEDQLAIYRRGNEETEENSENGQLSAEIIRTMKGRKAEEYPEDDKKFYYY